MDPDFQDRIRIFWPMRTQEKSLNRILTKGPGSVRQSAAHARLVAKAVSIKLISNQYTVSCTGI